MARQSAHSKRHTPKSARKRAPSTARRPRRPRSGSRKAPGKTRRWSAEVTERSDALDLKHGVFKHNDPKKIAASLKRSAERSKRRKSEPYRSAMSMLTFYMNRGGKNLSAARKKTLEKAKDELRLAFGRA